MRGFALLLLFGLLSGSMAQDNAADTEVVVAPLVTSSTSSSLVANLNFYYVIQVINGNTSAGRNDTFILSYQLDLIRAMNILAQNITDRLFPAASPGQQRQRQRRRRRLSISLQESSNITQLTDIECPAMVNASWSDLCQNVTHRVPVNYDMDDINSEQGTVSSIDLFEANLKAAIVNGSFEQQVQAANSEAPFVIVNVTTNTTNAAPTTTTATPAQSDNNRATAAAIIVVVLVVLTIGTAVLIHFTAKYRQQHRRDSGSKPSGTAAAAAAGKEEAVFKIVDPEDVKVVID